MTTKVIEGFILRILNISNSSLMLNIQLNLKQRNLTDLLNFICMDLVINRHYLIMHSCATKNLLKKRNM